jgi:hypothetical protein
MAVYILISSVGGLLLVVAAKGLLLPSMSCFVNMEGFMG